MNLSGDGEIVLFDDIACPANSKGMAFASRMCNECFGPIRESFREYKVVPFSITRSSSLDFDLEYDSFRNYGTENFTHGGIWWAYRFGSSIKTPKNDVPNISITANTTGLDVSINAELQKSQKVVIDRIKDNPSMFDRLLAEHGEIWLKTYLKYEHQPRFYHWVLADMKSPGEFDGEEILHMRHKHKEIFKEERDQWLHKIISGNANLSIRQINHLKNRNQRLNQAIRFVQPFQESAPFWSLHPTKQVQEIVEAVQCMKPLIDFFCKAK